MKFYRRSLLLFAWGAIALTLAIALARFHWRLEMLSHFRLPFAAGLLFLAILLCFQKSYKLTTGLAACLILQAIPLSQHYLPFSTDRRDVVGPQLKVITFNVLTRNSNHQEVLEFLNREDADFVGLQEISTEWTEALAPLRENYPHVIKHPRSDNFGLLFLSKHPITSHNLDTSHELGTPYLHTEIDWQGQALTVVTAHPLPPVTSGCARSRNHTLERIHADVTRSKNPVIVMGDLNCSTYSPFFRIVSRELRDSARGRGYQATWRRGHPILGIPIDHILYSNSLVCQTRNIGPKCGSDHSPIVATFQEAKP